ncbi:ABC transporter substrate-binding protein [Anaerocolumna sp.]|uniref:ABC transporter substrate-binding protein n=1 Tax=Anaerocolumna sp. TaxID=2041569 RepID=UPI0028A968D6|nr:ABC transporter substrate-binding protein [Anaerocolumna sp.]
MKKRLFVKIFLTVLTLTTLLAGCSAKNTNTDGADTNQNTGTENTQNESDAQEENSTDANQEGDNTGTMTVTDVKGDVEIPANPERIVDLSGNSDILSILGFKVVGTANSDAYDYTKFPTYLEEVLKGAAIVGYSMQDTMDIEAIMNLNPDLIIISTVQEKMYEQLQEIAPTIMIQLEALNWKDDVRTFAKLFNKEIEADTWILEYENKAKESGDKVKAASGENTTYLAFLASGGQFYVFDGAGFGSVLYEDMGLAKPKGMPEQSDISLPVVTYEGLAEIKADKIFVLATDEDLTTLNENAVWKSIPAVKEGNIINLPASPYFVQGYSSIGRDLLINEIVELLNGQK